MGELRTQVSSPKLGEVAATSRKYRDRHQYWSGRSGSLTEELQRPISETFRFWNHPAAAIKEVVPFSYCRSRPS